MEGGKYAKTLAKIQVRAIFHMCDFRRNVLLKFIELCMKTSCWCPYGLDQHGDRKAIETSVTEFCYESLHLPLKELINIKVILFLIREPFS